MSLKAKIEAVIYASEEPVTLAQLVGLLGEEAQAELDRAAAAQTTLALVEAEPRVEAEPAFEQNLAPAGAGEQADAVEAAEPTSENPDVGHPAEVAESVAIGTSAEPASENQDVAEPVSEQETVAGPVDTAAADAAAAKADKARAAKLRAYFRSVLDQLIAEYSAPESDRGLEIREVAGGFRFATKPEYHDAVRGFVKSLKPPLKLTLQALETLAVVAYKQPVTSPEISEIRGVDSSGVLGSLIARKLITTAGRKQVIGRPILYKTTREFLLKFGLKDVAELPSIEEFEKMAGQMAEQEDIPMNVDEELRPHAAETAEELGPETEEYVPQAEGELAVPEPVADEVMVDGRLSSLPPDYAAEDAADDPSAVEAEIQDGEAS